MGAAGEEHRQIRMTAVELFQHGAEGLAGSGTGVGGRTRGGGEWSWHGGAGHRSGSEPINRSGATACTARRAPAPDPTGTGQ